MVYIVVWKGGYDMKTHYEIFRDNLRREMNARKLSQSDVARICGASKQAVSTWMNATRAPRMDKIEILARYFGIPKSALLEEPSENIVQITGAVPVVGKIAAGAPILAQENIVDYLPVTVRHPDEYFALIVRGDSMINAGIPNGSQVLVHIQDYAENGQIVACRVNGDEATLKRFRQTGGTVLLMPENPNYEPIIVPAADFASGSAEILGVVKQVTVNI